MHRKMEEREEEDRKKEEFKLWKRDYERERPL